MPFDGSTTHKPAPTDDLVAARLQHTRNKIAAGKWCQHTTDDHHGNRCLLGWILWQPDDPVAVNAVARLWAELPKSFKLDTEFYAPHTLAQYNDTHTRHSIIRLLNRAIVAMETT